MKIVINSVLAGGKKTGIGTYIYNLVRALRRIDQNNEYFTVQREETKFFPLNDNHNIIIDIPSPLSRIKGSFLLWQFIFLPLKLKKHSEFSIVHDPWDLACFTFFNVKCKKVITVHDIASIITSDTTSKFNYLFHKVLLPRAINRADIIITVSEFSKGEIVLYCGVEPTKIKVIHQGIDERFKVLPKQELRQVIEKYKLPPVFILYVGSIFKQKNIQLLLRGYSKIKNEINATIVIVGKNMYDGNSPLIKLINQLNLKQHVMFTGYVSDDELPAFYNAASIFVFPSFYEGFGLPPLESMACGTPVITSNVSSLPEVIGNAGLMVAPYDVDGMAAAMKRLLQDQSLREQMKSKGLERVSHFSTEISARKTLDAYMELFASHQQFK